MIIHAPQRTLTANSLTVSARIEIQNARVAGPETLWFRLPAQYADMVSERLDAFVSALLFVAMHLGEDIEVRGVLSPRFALGLEASYQHAFAQWFPGRFKPVRLRAERYEASPPDSSKGRLAAFSGGVDSFYTLYTLRPESETRPGLAITHALNVAGFDVFLEDEARWRQIQAAHQALMDRNGLAYIPMATNVRHFTDALLGWEAWSECHGSATIGAALLLEPAFERFYFSSSYLFTVRAPWGSLPAIDPLLSTERMEVHHYGAGTARFFKAVAISEWPETWNHLRVCWRNPNGMNNCCRCQSCMRTMLALEVAGKLQQYSTFPLPLEFTHLPPGFPHEPSNLHPETIASLRAVGRHDLAEAYQRAIRGPALRRWLPRRK